MHKYRIIISGGGTGGHVFPAIAIAKEFILKYPNCDILFVGAKGKMEMKEVPKEGFPIKGLWISGFQRKMTIKNLLFPIKVIFSIVKAYKIVKAFKPDIVIGTGGYASAPTLLVAAKKAVPCFIQEQNSFPGITNRLLARYAKKIFVAYEGLEDFFPDKKLMLLGNPIRQDLLNIDSKREEGQKFFNLNAQQKTVLILGGSLGARAINSIAKKKLSFFESLNIQLIWQCGKLYADEYLKNNKPEKGINVVKFIDKMDLAYAAADIVISRSGALIISELALVGKPTIFIPSPNVAQDHQTKNAKAIEAQKACIVLDEKELDSKLESVFLDLIENQEKQNSLGENFKKYAKPKSAEAIVEQITKYL